MAALTRSNPTACHRLLLGDLSRLSEMNRIAAEVTASEPRVDVLVNNAGAVFGARAVTEDGLERTFATNHMAYVVLTLGLRGPLAATPGARVVSTASAAHHGQAYDPADVQSLQHYKAWRAYGRSKLYNILFTRELARRWAPLGIAAYSHHPGFVATRFGDASGGWMGPLLRVAKRLFAITPEKGAETLVYLASSPKVAGASGSYFDKQVAVQPTAAGRDDAAAAALWAESLRLARLTDA